MESTEAPVVAKAKRDRPVVILATNKVFEPKPGSNELSTHLICAPMYSIPEQSSESFRTRLAGYAFPNLFYLPEDKSVGISEGFLRLDHMQPIKAERMNGHRGCRLSEDALSTLHEWLLHFFTGELEEGSVLRDYMESVQR